MCLCGRSRFIMIGCGHVIWVCMYVRVSLGLCVPVWRLCVYRRICVHGGMHAHVCYPELVYAYRPRAVGFLYMPPCVSLLTCVSIRISTCVSFLCASRPLQRCVPCPSVQVCLSDDVDAAPAPSLCLAEPVWIWEIDLPPPRVRRVTPIRHGEKVISLLLSLCVFLQSHLTPASSHVTSVANINTGN